VFLTEGLLGYLPADEVSRLWTRMHALSSSHSHYGGDWTTTDLFTSPLTTRLLDKLKDMKAPLISGCDKPENLLKETGWDRPDVVALGEERASYGLWPYKPKPRWWPSLLPRVWFITASTTMAKKARQ
jgi:O-methyltransferase involved in polyketide biosynthesis